MYPDARMREPHAFDWLCGACRLDPVCLRRTLFVTSAPIPEHRPFPHEAIPESLRAWVEGSARGAAALARATAPRSVAARPAWAGGDPAAGLWAGFVAGTLLPMARRELARAGQADAAEVLTASDGPAVRIAPRGVVPAYIELSATSEPSASGFLCGPVRLCVAEDVCAEAAYAPAVRSVAAALHDLAHRGAWPQGLPRLMTPFLVSVWRTFGRALLPRSSRGNVVQRGSVGADEVRLGVLTTDGIEFDIAFVPSSKATRAHVRGAHIALRYERIPVRDSASVLRIVHGYSALLMGSG